MGEKRCFVSEYSSLLLDNRKCEKVDNGIFETEMYELVPEHNRDYHFCESITRLFAEAGRWTEVFPALYGQMPKYNGFNV